MKALFRVFMAFHVWIYRLSGGRLGGSMGRNKVILLNTTGRKSGKVYTTPLGCFEGEGGYVIVASNAGQPENPAWYYNLKSRPQTTVQLLDRVIPVTAEILSGEARTQAWRQVVAEAPGYANYEKRTTREIPLILLRPTQAAG